MQGKSTKRQKEQARQQRRQEKESKRAERRKLKSERPARQPGEVDPDIAGIIPGPQPDPEWEAPGLEGSSAEAPSKE